MSAVRHTAVSFALLLFLYVQHVNNCQLRRGVTSHVLPNSQCTISPHIRHSLRLIATFFYCFLVADAAFLPTSNGFLVVKGAVRT